MDISTLNHFLQIKTFKEETPESVILSLKKERVTSLDFSKPHPESISDTNIRTKLSSIGLFLLWQDLGWVVNLQKIKPESEAGLYLCRALVLSCSRNGQIHHREVAGPELKSQLPSCKTKLLSQPFHVPDKSVIHKRETGTIRLPSHEALNNNRHIPESLEKLIHIPNYLHPHLLSWLKKENALFSRPLHLIHHAVQIFTD